MSIRVASFVQIEKRQTMGYIGNRTEYCVTIVTQDLIIYPMIDSGYGSGWTSLSSAMSWANQVAESLQLEVIELG